MNELRSSSECEDTMNLLPEVQEYFSVFNQTYESEISEYLFVE